MLGQNIRMLRQARGLSQVDLGKRLNVSKQSISNWENDNIMPSVETLVQMADFSPSARIIYWAAPINNIWTCLA